MKKILILILSITLNSYGQTTYIFPEKNVILQEKNGFQDIKLGSRITEIFPNTQDYREIYIDGYNYIYTGSKYKSIGDVEIIRLLLKVNSNMQIECIKIICDYTPILMAYIEGKYGKGSNLYNDDQYERGKAWFRMKTWESQDVTLYVTSKEYYNLSDSNHSSIPNFISLEYTSKKLMEDEKRYNEIKLKNKIKKAADDF